MHEAEEMILAINVRLKSSDPSSHPRAVNYANVGVAQGIAMWIRVHRAVLLAAHSENNKTWTRRLSAKLKAN